MDQPCQPSTVIVDRQLALGRKPELDRISGTCHFDVIDPETHRPAQDEKGQTIVGDFNGFYRLMSGLYAHEDQVRAPLEGEIEMIMAREAAALGAIEESRAQMWGGGGRVVYTDGW